MTPTKTVIAAVLAATALGAAAAPEIASASSCHVTKTRVVHRTVHRKVVRRPVAVAAYRESVPRTVTRTVVETRYIHEPTRVIVAPAPIYYHSYYRDYAPYPVYYHHYEYARPYWHHGSYGGYHHRHW